MRPPLEVADIFRQHGYDFRLTHPLSPEQRRVMRAIERCRTAALGGHVEQCDTCGHQRISYNSCRNRHCPKCQSLAKARWLEARLADLLPVEYFHVVFTLPEQLAPVALQNKRVVYNLLFACCRRDLAHDRGRPADTSAPRSAFWQCCTPGARLAAPSSCALRGSGRRLVSRGRALGQLSPGFFLPVNVLARLFRVSSCKLWSAPIEKGQLTFHGTSAYLGKPLAFKRLLASLRAREWWVYAKPPFGGPDASVGLPAAATRIAWPSPTTGCSH